MVTQEKAPTKREGFGSKFRPGPPSLTPPDERRAVHAILLARGRRNARLAGLLLHIVQFLLGVVERFLFLIDLLLILCVFLVPAAGITQAVSGIGIERGGTQAILAL